MARTVALGSSLTHKQCLPAGEWAGTHMGGWTGGRTGGRAARRPYQRPEEKGEQHSTLQHHPNRAVAPGAERLPCQCLLRACTMKPSPSGAATLDAKPTQCTGLQSLQVLIAARANQTLQRTLRPPLNAPTKPETMLSPVTLYMLVASTATLNSNSPSLRGRGGLISAACLPPGVDAAAGLSVPPTQLRAAA